MIHMNKKALYLAIVTVVAVGIVVGLWLTGAGLTGPLSGDVLPHETHLTLSFDPENCQYFAGENCEGKLTGTLLDYKGDPLVGKGLVLYCASDAGVRAGEWILCYSVTPTQADGSFSATLGFMAGDMMDVKVVFQGDADNLPTEAVLQNVWC